MTNLLTQPLSQANDLGKPIPSWPHATSVCMPLWEHNVGYEEGREDIVQVLSCGYPRFVYHPFVRKLFAECEKKFANPNEFCFAYPSRKSAENFRSFIEQKTGISGRLNDLGIQGIHVVTLPKSIENEAKCFWQHTGEGISSRQAQAVFERSNDVFLNNDSKDLLRARISHYCDGSANDVFLFPSGMSAIYNIFSIVHQLYPQRKSVQFGFPYVDTLKIQQKFGAGVHFLAKGDANDLDKLESIVAKEKISAIFCEFPMNPLMRSPDLKRLAILANEHTIPLVVDDTIGSFENIRAIPPADILVTSLTKFFSGAGDVMGGSVVLNPTSTLYPSLSQLCRASFEDNLWPADADVLERNSRDFAERITKINRTTETLCDLLEHHRFVDTIFYPKFQTPENYDAFKKKNGGYSGVFSIVLRNPEESSATFFNALNISKGPSLGTNFSLACPYTILAHYQELEFAETCGVSRHLIRVSIGLEEVDDLIHRFENALNSLISSDT